MRDDLNAIPVFVTVVESGNFASAAAILHVTRSAVGKTIARLEARLGVALFQRTTRRQLLTEEGEQFYLQCREALERIREAEGEAQALMTVQKALADSIRLLNDAAPTDKVLAIKSLEALQKVADGKATKLIIPSEIQGLAGLAASAKTIFDTEDPKATITKTVPKQ